MSILLALLLVVQGGVHISYVCGPAWPFVATDPWLVSSLGVGPDGIRTAGIALAVLTFVAFLLAALTAVGVLPGSLWAPLIVVASMASAIVLVLFVTPSTLPFLAIDALLLWATLVQGWHPTPFFGS